MAKKTKQEKIIADLRRRLQVQERQFSPLKTELTPKVRLEPEEKIKERPIVNTFAIPTDLIKKDLMKTLILSGVAISLEFVLYFIWR
jgi:hypothetical protein